MFFSEAQIRLGHQTLKETALHETRGKKNESRKLSFDIRVMIVLHFKRQVFILLDGKLEGEKSYFIFPCFIFIFEAMSNLMISGRRSAEKWLFTTSMPGESYNGPLPELSPLEVEICNRLRKHIYALAESIGERNIWKYVALNQSAEYIETNLTKLDYPVSSQKFRCEGKWVRNLEIELPGGSQSEEIVLIGAHYDTVMGSPGANDNASGVAALCELARLLSQEERERTIRLVAFVNEEPPFYQSGKMGSRIYARRARRQKENIVAMFSLETIGYYCDTPGSQHYPFPLGAYYPKVGNFIGFVANRASKVLLFQVIELFRRHTCFPSEGVAAPQWLPGISWSDQWCFWKEGYPALMITDTAPFRYPYYHSAADTANKICYDKLARVVAGFARVLKELSDIS
ncbi:MAG: hypothetical protein Kow0042_05310 [Calditrichia bacterium]